MAVLNPQQRRYSDRLRDLAAEGEEISRQVTGEFRFLADHVGLHAWLAKSQNVIHAVFGPASTQATQYARLTERVPAHRQDALNIVGLLTGARDDLESGFLTRQEFILAGQIYDSVLEEAKELNRAGHKDAAAVLMRVALEDALRRLARDEGIDPTDIKAAVLNDRLKDTRYPQVQWRQNQACLDVGNHAAHGEFDKYSRADVQARIEDVGRFFAAHLTA